MGYSKAGDENIINGDMNSDIITDTKVGGLRAIEINYRGIREFETGELAFLQSRSRLNTPDLGTLMPETYRKVAELSNQCVSLFELELTQILDTIKRLTKRDFYFRWVSVYMPLRHLEMKGLQQKMMSIMDEAEVDTNKLCFEISPNLLISGNVQHRNNIEQLRNHGFHVMLTDFGGINSPLMKLAYYPVDYVMMSREILKYLNEDDRSLSAVTAIVDFAEEMGASAIADGVTNANQAELLYRAQFRFGAGSLIGKYQTERSFKNKNDKESE